MTVNTFLLLSCSIIASSKTLLKMNSYKSSITYSSMRQVEPYLKEMSYSEILNNVDKNVLTLLCKELIDNESLSGKEFIDIISLVSNNHTK